MNSNWGPAAVIVFGYIIAAYWQNKRVDDLKMWISAEFKALNTLMDLQFKTVNEKLDKLDGRVKALEDARASGVIGVR